MVRHGEVQSFPSDRAGERCLIRDVCQLPLLVLAGGLADLRVAGEQGGDADRGEERGALFAETVRRWQAAGTFDSGADPDGVAQLLQSICLGFAAQRALAGDVVVRAPGDALAAVVRESG